MSADTGLKFQGEKQDFEEMTGNLIDNACKWAEEVAVTARRSGDGNRRDRGRRWAGIDQGGAGKERSNAASGSTTKPGSGLGLSIVADLAHLYKGRFELEKGPKGGLRARLTLPAA